MASALLDFLLDLEIKMEKCPSTIHLFSDSCPSQNKNSVIMTMLIAFLERSKAFSRIRHFFPIRGHSYMPPDRVFGRVEKEYRRKEDICHQMNTTTSCNPMELPKFSTGTGKSRH